MSIMDTVCDRTRQANRRIRRACAALLSLRENAAQGAGVDPECVSDLLSLEAKIRHLDFTHCKRWGKAVEAMLMEH